MTAFHSSPRMLGQKQDKFWLTVGLCALTAALIFLPFYLPGSRSCWDKKRINSG